MGAFSQNNRNVYFIQYLAPGRREIWVFWFFLKKIRIRGASRLPPIVREIDILCTVTANLPENSWSERQTLKHTLAWFWGKTHLQFERAGREGASCVTAVIHQGCLVWFGPPMLPISVYINLLFLADHVMFPGKWSAVLAHSFLFWFYTLTPVVRCLWSTMPSRWLEGGGGKFA